MLRRTAALAAVICVLATAGCNGSKSTSKGHHLPSRKSRTTSAAPASSGPSSSAGGTIPVGAGPQARYTVQQYPAPGSCHYRYTAAREPLQDLTCNPGATSPAVTQATLAQTICRKGGYTSGIRPPVSVTGPEKRASAAAYGYTGTMIDGEFDHLISLQLGGDPNDPRNLWVEPTDPGHKPGSGPNNLKDPVETKLHTAVCSGKVTLVQAQQAIATDWTTALSSLSIS